eukprot:39451_1
MSQTFVWATLDENPVLYIDNTSTFMILVILSLILTISTLLLCEYRFLPHWIQAELTKRYPLYQTIPTILASYLEDNEDIVAVCLSYLVANKNIQTTIHNIKTKSYSNNLSCNSCCAGGRICVYILIGFLLYISYYGLYFIVINSALTDKFIERDCLVWDQTESAKTIFQIILPTTNDIIYLVEAPFDCNGVGEQYTEGCRGCAGYRRILQTSPPECQNEKCYVFEDENRDNIKVRIFESDTEQYCNCCGWSCQCWNQCCCGKCGGCNACCCQFFWYLVLILMIVAIIALGWCLFQIGIDWNEIYEVYKDVNEFEIELV